MDKESLSFYVGQLVEATTFEKGYRGSWWRSKIINIRRSKNKVFHTLEYYDFPEEGVHTMELYQKCEGINNNQKVLMVRPQFPPVYRRNEVPNTTGVSEYVVLNDNWKVGDLVDWWKDDCYWSGTIARILGDDKFEVKLFPPPFGEGERKKGEEPYEPSSNNLRPSLNWSFENGWTVPVSKVGRKGRRCAQVIKHTTEDNPVCSASISGSHIKDTGVETSSSVCETKDDDSGGIKTAVSHSVVVDTIEAAVLDLEELISKMNWIKSLLDDQKPSSDRNSWKFVEHIGSSTPK